MSNSITREEILLSSIANEQNSNLSPITREEQYLSYIAGETNSLPSKPITRKEMLLDKIAKNSISGGGGSSAILVEKTITENGEYPAVNDGADGYSKVVVNVASGGGDTENALDAFVEGSLTDVILHSATKVKASAFYSDRKLYTIKMLKVTLIGDNAFNGCSQLVSVELPNGLTTIGGGGFRNCNSLKSIELPNTLTTIGNNGFWGCVDLEQVTIPSGITLNFNSFRECTSLSTVTFKGVANTIDPTVFLSCTNLTTINVPWAEGEVANAPWGAENATINYNYTGE